jgi:hypothetical protein
MTIKAAQALATALREEAMMKPENPHTNRTVQQEISVGFLCRVAVQDGIF